MYLEVNSLTSDQYQEDTDTNLVKLITTKNTKKAPIKYLSFSLLAMAKFSL